MFKRLTLAAVLASSASFVAASPLDEIVSVEVIPGWQTPSGNQMAGLRIALAPGWKTYWRAPGDAGIPPVIRFSGSKNVTEARMQWPTPEVFFEHGLRSVGYLEDVVIAIELTPNTVGDPISLSGDMQIGVCEEICVPAHLTFDAEVPSNGGRAPAIVASLINRPLTADEAGVTTAICAFTPHQDGILVQTTLGMPPAGATEEVVIEAGDPSVWVSEPEVVRDGAQLVARSLMVHTGGEAFALDRSAIRITVLGDEHAVDVTGCKAG